MYTNQAYSTGYDQSFMDQLAVMAKGDIGLLEVSSKLRVTPKTVKKILEGRPVSYYVKTKIQTALRHGLRRSDPQKPSEIQRLIDVNRLYKESGTLRSAGAKIGLSQERIRQLLYKGAQIGLFDYQPSRRKRPVITKKKIIGDYKKFLTLNRVAAENKITLSYLQRLRTMHRIDNTELAEIRAENQRRECLKAYHVIVKQLGGHPTTTKLQQLKGGRYLEAKIRRLWGSFLSFRYLLKHSPTPLLVRLQFKAKIQTNTLLKNPSPPFKDCLSSP